MLKYSSVFHTTSDDLKWDTLAAPHGFVNLFVDGERERHCG